MNQFNLIRRTGEDWMWSLVSSWIIDNHLIHRFNQIEAFSSHSMGSGINHLTNNAIVDNPHTISNFEFHVNLLLLLSDN